jgi:hypothetical protein
MPTITIDEARAAHLFRDAKGHFREDNAVNRRLLLDVASRPENFRGTDQFGTDWFMETRGDGTQVWVHVRGGKITNGGANAIPREFDEAI